MIIFLSTLSLIMVVGFSVMALGVAFGIGYLWCKHIFWKNYIKIVENKLEEFTKGSDIVLFEDGKILLYQEGEPLLIEDCEGDIGLFVLVKKFKRTG